MRIQFLAILAMAGCLLYSCSKYKNDDRSGPPGGEPDPQEVIKYLQSYRTVEPDNSATRFNVLLDANGKFKGFETVNDLTGFDEEEVGKTEHFFDDKMNLTGEKFAYGGFSHEITYEYQTNGEPKQGIEVITHIQTGTKSTVTMQYTVSDKKVTKIRIQGSNGLDQTSELTYKDGNIIREVVKDEDGVFMEATFSFGKAKSPLYAYRLKWCLRPSIHMVLYNTHMVTKSHSKFRTDLRFTEEPADTSVIRADADGYPVYIASVALGQTDSSRTTFTYKP